MVVFLQMLLFIASFEFSLFEVTLTTTNTILQSQLPMSLNIILTPIPQFHIYFFNERTHDVQRGNDIE